VADEKVRHPVVVRRVTRVFDGFLKVDEAEVSYPRFDGTSETVVRLCLERGDSAAALIIDREHDAVLLTEQFRYPTLAKDTGWIVEVVAGSIEDGESPGDCIRREIFEEVGYRVDDLEEIGRFYVTPGGSSERIWLFACVVDRRTSREVRERYGVASEGEDIRLVTQSIDEFLAAASAGRLSDAKTLIAAWWLHANRGRLRA
jgi:nudix-type nucleoside diphosphatase (YffH/AdpP family)